MISIDFIYALRVLERGCTFSLRTTVRMIRGSPSVQVYTSSDDTFVHIRQLIYSTNGGGEATVSETQDGIMMSLMEFRSLMFQLRALDLQFTQRVETTSVVQESAEQKFDQTKSVGMKRTWDECEGNIAAANVEHMNDDSGGNVVDEIAVQAWNELGTILESLAPSGETIASVPVKDESICQENVIEPSKKVVITQAQVNTELAIIFAEELNDLILEQVVKDACFGCKNDIDKDTNPSQHDVCTMSRKDRINLYSEAALALVNEEKVHKKLTMRLLSRNVMFTEELDYTKVDVLITKPRWMNKLKKLVFEM